MNLARWLMSLCVIFNFSTAVADTLEGRLIGKRGISASGEINNRLYEKGNDVFPGDNISLEEYNSYKITKFGYPLKDSLPKTIKDLVIIPFEYKQSALYHPFTFKAIDSVIDILLENDSVTLSIEGYAHVDEGIDSICYYLSLNRALVIRDYILGRGIDSSRILSLKGYGNIRSVNRKPDNQAIAFNCRTELLMNYPIPPPLLAIMDKDEDGIVDNVDQCPDEYGESINKGCPKRGAIIVPFEMQQSALFSMTYRVLDSVVNILLENPSINIYIEGYACKKEGIETLCDQLAKERADITKRYLLTRQISSSRILSVKSFGNLHPLNACRNPREIARNLRAEIYLIHP